MVPLRLSVTSVLLISSFLSAAYAFNITRILDHYPDYTTFNDLLTQTGLASEINQRSTITVLVVSNEHIRDLSSLPTEVKESILRTHIILDYFDLMKLNQLKDNTAKLTTMYQQTGVASYDQGFLNVTTGENGIVFGSAVKNAPHDARLVGSVMSRPYNISVLSVSHPIVTPGLDGSFQPVAAPPPLPKSKVPAPVPSHKEEAVPAPVEAPVEADAPAANADSPSFSPAGSPPEPADGPEADADAPGADAPDADTADTSKSMARKSRISFGGFFVLGALMAAL